MSNSIKAASHLKAAYELANPEGKFFTKENMKFSGDTMSNYGVRAQIEEVETYSDDAPVLCFVLYRKRSVKHGLNADAYFSVDGLELTHSK